MNNEIRCFRISYIHNKDFHSIDVNVETSQDILSKGKKYLIRKLLQEILTQEDSSLPEKEYEEVKRIKKNRAIHLASGYDVASVRFLPLCEGCQYSSGSQRDHMISPYGCML